MDLVYVKMGIVGANLRRIGGINVAVFFQSSDLFGMFPTMLLNGIMKDLVRKKYYFNSLVYDYE